MVPLTAANFESFTPRVFKESGPPPYGKEFYLIIPTAIDKDNINARLRMAGLAPVKQGYFRAAVIDELYNVHPEEKADELAAFIEEAWTQVELHTSMLVAWAEQERERQADEDHGAAARPAIPIPTSLLKPRDRSRLDMLVEETVNESPRLLRIEAKRESYELDMRILLVRFHLAGWKGFRTERRATAAGGQDELLDLDCLLELRDEIGEVAWDELLSHTYGLYSLSREEVGNSDSLLAMPGSENGSDEHSDASATSAGTSAKPARKAKSRSGTSPAQTGGSRKTIARSSMPTSRSVTAKAPKSGRTVAAAPNNR